MLKRRVGYFDEEASITRTKFARMELTQQESTQMEINNENELEGESRSSVAHNQSLPPSES